MITLITGGVKSGKSGRLLDLARGWPPPVYFVATALAFDEEMANRIERHKAERSDQFITIEEPLKIDDAISKCGANVVVDCLPMWVNNIIFYKNDHNFSQILDNFIEIMLKKENCAIVTNETGLGNIPFDAETRRYNLLLAEANRKIAAAACKVELMVCGIPLQVKGPGA